LFVVGSLFFHLQQAEFGRRELIENPLRESGMPSRLKRPHVSHLPRGCILNHVRIVFEMGNPQQPVVVRGLVLGGDAEPLAIRIERVGHSGDCLGVLQNHSWVAFHYRWVGGK
jgi:hypothetical protein